MKHIYAKTKQNKTKRQNEKIAEQKQKWLNKDRRGQTAQRTAEHKSPCATPLYMHENEYSARRHGAYNDRYLLVIFIFYINVHIYVRTYVHIGHFHFY